MATEVDFPLLPGNRAPEQQSLPFPLSFAFSDGSSAPLFRRGVVSALELEEVAQSSAELITTQYAGQRILIVQILEGARIFAQMLQPYLDQLSPAAGMDYEMGAVQVRSYGHGSHASAHQIITPLRNSLGEEITDCSTFDGLVLVDDLIDAGNTLAWLAMEYLPRFTAKGIGFCTMLDKTRPRTSTVEKILRRHLISAGRQVPNDWLVGYGLDMALPGTREIPPLHLFRQPLPGGVYAFNSDIEKRLIQEYQQRPAWVTEQLNSYRCSE